MSLDRDAILGADDLETEEVKVPEWKGTVWVRTLTGRERDRFEIGTLADPKKGDGVMNLDNLRARLVIEACVDEKGKRLFGAEDVDAVGAKNAAALDRVFDVAKRLAGISDKDVKELAKNSSSGPGGSSPSD